MEYHLNTLWPKVKLNTNIPLTMGCSRKKNRSREGGGIYIVQGYRKKPEKLTCTLGEFNMSRGKLCVQGGQFDA